MIIVSFVWFSILLEITEHRPLPPPVYEQYGEHQIVFDAQHQPLSQAGAQPNINTQNVQYIGMHDLACT